MTTREQACNLVASNLPPSVGDAQLAALFSRFGAVSSVRVMVDVRTGLSRGFGFVLMADQAAADAAVAATGKFNIEVADASGAGKKSAAGTATPPDVALVPAGAPPAHEGAPSRGPPLLIGYAGAGARVPGTPTSTVYVRNLPRAVTAAQVRAFMARAVPAHVAAAALAGGGRAALVTHVALHLPKPNATASSAAAGMGMGMMDDHQLQDLCGSGAVAGGGNGSSSGAAAANNNGGGAICPHGAATDSVRAHVTFATPECAVAAAVATNGVMFTLAAAEGEVEGHHHDPQQQTATRILVKVVDQDHVKTAANPRRAGRGGAPGTGTTGRSQQPLVSLTPLGTSGDHSSSSQNAASHLSFVTAAPTATPGAVAHFSVDLQQLQLLQQQQQLLLNGGFGAAGFGASSSLMGAALPLGGTWSSSSTIMPISKQQLPQQQQQQQGSPLEAQMLRVNNLAAPFVAPMVMPPAAAPPGNLAAAAAPSFPAMPYLTVLPPTGAAQQQFASPNTAAPLPLHQPQQQQPALPQQPPPPQYLGAQPSMQPTPISYAALQQLALTHQVPLAPGVSTAAGGANANSNVTLGGGATARQWPSTMQQQQALPLQQQHHQQQQQQAGYTLGYAGAQLPQQAMWPPAGSLATMQPSANGGAPVVMYLSSMPPQSLGSAAAATSAPQQPPHQQQQMVDQQQRPVFYVLPQPITSAAQ